jgi:ADP-ribose pyrophosphatase
MWEITDRKILYQSPYIRFVEKEVKTPSGKANFATFDLPDFCNVIAVTEHAHVILVKQLRMGIEDFTLEIPGGCVDPSDKDPKASAIRELREETGYALAENGRVESLGWTYPNPALQANRCHFFILGPVRKVGPPENPPDEETEVFLAPIDGIADSIRTSTLNHALMLNAFLFLGLSARKTGFSFEEQLLRFARPANRRA